MSACGYEFYLLWEILSTLEDKIRIHSRACNILYIIHVRVGRYHQLHLRPCYTRQFFLQLVSQRWRLKNIASCRGGVTRSQYFFATCNAPSGNCLQLFLRQLEISCERKTGSDCLIFTKLPCRFRWTCHTQDISTFLATRNATFCCRCRLQNWGVIHVKSFLQLVSQQKVARKIASCNMAFSFFEGKSY